MGEDERDLCPQWRAAQGSASAGPRVVGLETAEADAIGTAWRPAWSGSAFGVADLELVAARRRPRLVALVGPHDAGKTTLLGATYLALTRSGRLGPDRFAGSYTLGGWEAVSHGMRWRPGVPPGFPPHTPSGAGRAPGLLHLALRQSEGGLVDLLVTDAPGEWFTRWASDRNAEEAQGAQWIARHADAFVLVLDSAALAGAARGEARARSALLAQRLGAEAGGRPVAAVWAKADVSVPAGMRQSINDAVNRFIPNVVEFAVALPPAGVPALGLAEIGDVLAWALAAAGTARPRALRSEPHPPVMTIGAGSGSGIVDPFIQFRVRTRQAEA
jgi:hypothetical protein